MSDLRDQYLQGRQAGRSPDGDLPTGDEVVGGESEQLQPGGKRQYQPIFGHALTRVLNWMGKKGWTLEEVRWALEKLGIEEMKESTLRTAWTDSRNPKYSKTAELTEEEKQKLREMRG